MLAEAQAAGRGGISEVARSTRVSRSDIRAGMKELRGNAESKPTDFSRIRRAVVVAKRPMLRILNCYRHLSGWWLPRRAVTPLCD